MSAMFSQNPLMNGPNYSFSDTPRSNNGELREHRFNP
jgi:20S proteasome subunit beta 6